MIKNWGGLAANVTIPCRMTIRHPATGQPIVDAAGRQAHVDLLSQDSGPGRQLFKDRTAAEIDRLARGEKTAAGPDPIDDQVETLAVLTTGWHLVDPVTREPIDYAFDGPASARALFAAPELAWLRRQAWSHVVDERNFMPASPAS
ncbi:hypothetical protein [Rhodoplanes sp. SY1]|uniref:hypothetical protein n=1 Tax=Rhodoplanes sp. SY1 TaxID=3166646 RepID=UPI0038B57114